MESVFESKVLKGAGGFQINSTLFFKIHTHRINAVSDSSLIFRSIGETMPEVTAAIRTEDFLPDHKVTVVHLHVDGFWADRFGETRPTATAVVLFGGVENLIPTGTAFVDSGVFIQIILPGKRSLRSFFPQHVIGVRIQDLLPLRLILLNRIHFRFLLSLISIKYSHLNNSIT